VSFHRAGRGTSQVSAADVLTGERAAALRRVTRRKFRRIKTLAGDKGYCTKDFVVALGAAVAQPAPRLHRGWSQGTSTS